MTTTFPPGAPCWIDLLTSDAPRARDFYAAVFGWVADAASAEFGGYFMFLRDGVPVAGCVPASGSDVAPDVWSSYLTTPDARAALTRAVDAGASVFMDAMDIADLGTSAFLVDPSGGRIGLWQPDTFTGFGPTGPAATNGTACYFELHTRDFDAAVAFYRDVLAWDAVTRSEVPGMRYATLGPGDASAGIMDATDHLPPGEEPSWHVYFATDDVDATVARVEAGGGSVRFAAMDTPFGRSAGVADPMGARFWLLGPSNG